MRMSTYYLVLLGLSILGLVATALAGVLGTPVHLTIALPTAILTVLTHSMVVVFILIGTRLVREGVDNCGLSKDFLARSNTYFKELTGLFLSIGGAFSIVAAAVLGYGNRAFGFPPEVHLLAGLAAAGVTLVAIPYEVGALRRMERLLDETRETLAKEDELRAAEGLPAVDADHVPYKDSPAHIGAFIAISPMCVYLYQLLVLWRGDFSRVTLWPYLAVSLVGVFLWWRGRGKEPAGEE